MARVDRESEAPFRSRQHLLATKTENHPQIEMCISARRIRCHELAQLAFGRRQPTSAECSQELRRTRCRHFHWKSEMGAPGQTDGLSDFLMGRWHTPNQETS